MEIGNKICKQENLGILGLSEKPRDRKAYESNCPWCLIRNEVDYTVYTVYVARNVMLKNGKLLNYYQPI